MIRLESSFGSTWPWHTRLLRLATVGVGAYRRSISLSWLQHATTVFRFWESWHSAHYRGTTAGESCWTQCRPCAQGRDRDDPFEMSGQVRSSQVNKIKQVHEIAKVATFALSREKLYPSNLWIDSQVMHANKQMRAFLPTKTESPWFWSWSPIIYVEVSQQLLVQSTQDFGGKMLQQLPEILLLRFIIRDTSANVSCHEYYLFNPRMLHSGLMGPFLRQAVSCHQRSIVIVDSWTYWLILVDPSWSLLSPNVPNRSIFGTEDCKDLLAGPGTLGHCFTVETSSHGHLRTQLIPAVPNAYCTVSSEYIYIIYI